MIRLYPQVVKSEGNIQDLRRLLSEIHNENLQQCDHLTEAALRIRELGAELGKADYDKKDRIQDYQDAQDVASVQQQRYMEQLDICRGLRGEVAESEAIYERQLGALVESELESKERWDVLLNRDSEYADLSTCVFEHRDEHEELRLQLAQSEERWRARSMEYGQAECIAAEHRREIREADVETAEHERNASSLEAECVQLRQEKTRLAALLKGLRVQQSALDGVEPINAELREEVGVLKADCNQLQDSLSTLEPEWKRLEVELQISMEGLEVLQQLIESEDSDIHELKDKLVKAEQKNMELEKILETEQKGGQDMRRRASSAEKVARQFENERRGQLDQLTEVCNDLAEQVSLMESETKGLRSQLQQQDAANQERIDKLKRIKQEARDLQEAAEQAEKLLESEKKRCRCVLM